MIKKIIICSACKGEFESDNPFLINMGTGFCNRPECVEKRKKRDAEIREAEEFERRTERITAIKEAMGLAKRYRNADISSLTLPARIKEVATAYLTKPGGLFLCGIYGSGKTYLAAAIANEIAKQCKDVLFYSFPQLLQDIRESFNNKEGNEGEIIRQCQNVDLFVLDDLGAEKQSDFSLDRLYLIIDYRYGNIMPTIITSNLSIGDVSRKIHERLASRFAEMCQVIKLPDKSLRLKEIKAEA